MRFQYIETALRAEAIEKKRCVRPEHWHVKAPLMLQQMALIDRDNEWTH
jgi:hypothetical protein